MQTGSVPLQRPLDWQERVWEPLNWKPGSHEYDTSLPYSCLDPMRNPFSGVPGSPQSTNWHTGRAPLHNPDAWHIRVLSPINAYPGLHEYTTESR